MMQKNRSIDNVIMEFYDTDIDILATKGFIYSQKLQRNIFISCHDIQIPKDSKSFYQNKMANMLPSDKIAYAARFMYRYIEEEYPDLPESILVEKSEMISIILAIKARRLGFNDSVSMICASVLAQLANDEIKRDNAIYQMVAMMPENSRAN